MKPRPSAPLGRPSSTAQPQPPLEPGCGAVAPPPAPASTELPPPIPPAPVVALLLALDALEELDVGPLPPMPPPPPLPVGIVHVPIWQVPPVHIVPSGFAGDEHMPVI